MLLLQQLVVVMVTAVGLVIVGGWVLHVLMPRIQAQLANNQPEELQSLMWTLGP